MADPWPHGQRLTGDRVFAGTRQRPGPCAGFARVGPAPHGVSANGWWIHVPQSILRSPLHRSKLMIQSLPFSISTGKSMTRTSFMIGFSFLTNV